MRAVCGYLRPGKSDSGPRPAFGGGRKEGNGRIAIKRAGADSDGSDERQGVRADEAKEIAILLNLPKSQRDELKEVLDYLVAEGKVGLSKKGKYGKPETFSVNGIFSGHPKGFGFVTVEGMDRDVFIPEDRTGQP